MRFPNALNGHLGDTQVPSHRAGAPAGGRRRLLLGRDLNHALHKFRGKARFATGPRAVLKRFQAIFGPASPPPQHRFAIGLQGLRDDVIRQTLSRQQHDPGTEHQFLRCASPPYPLIQRRTLSFAHTQRLRRFPHKRS